MKNALAATSLALLVTTSALAQSPSAGRTAKVDAPPTATASKGIFSKTTGNALNLKVSPKRDPNVLRSGDSTPDLVPFEDLQAGNLPPLAEPLENYLLQKEHGPFMVAAKTFRGPDASRYAQILAAELRRDYHLPAYVWLARYQPGRSNIQGVQPTAPPYTRNGDMADPERKRSYDEAAVLVGNCKTEDEAGKLLKQVKAIKPACMANFPTIYLNRKGKGLNYAFQTTNPFQPSQNLFPGNGTNQPTALAIKQGAAIDPYVQIASMEKARKVDPLVKRMNTGPDCPYSLFKNPGAYTIQVAAFTGTSQVVYGKGNIPDDPERLKQSPLVTAHDDAEKFASALSKCQTLNGVKPYVFHTRFGSYVTIGSFSSPRDPNVEVVMKQTDKISNELLMRQLSFMPLSPSRKLRPVPSLENPAAFDKLDAVVEGVSTK